MSTNSSLTLREFINAVVSESIKFAEEKGFKIKADDRQTINRRVSAIHMPRKKEVLDWFTTKEDPQELVKATIERAIGMSQLGMAVVFETTEDCNSETALSQIAEGIVAMVVNNVFGGKSGEFSPLLKDIDVILAYATRRKILEKSHKDEKFHLRPEDLDDLSKALTKTLIDVEAFLKKVDEGVISYGQYL